MSPNKEKQQALAKRMAALSIREEDLEEHFILGSGKGGQKVNKTASCVQLKHLPSGIVIKCQKERSRALNRYYARRELCEKLEAKETEIQTEKAKEIAKVRKQKARRKRKTKEKILADKKHRSGIKELRKKPSLNSKNEL